MMDVFRHCEMSAGIKAEGQGSQTEALQRMPRDRQFPTLSEAASITETYSYWISLHSKELEPRMVKGKSYSGRTFEGMPQEKGHYAINHDNTFTELRSKEDAEWSERLYVSELAAIKAKYGYGDIAILYIMRREAHFPMLDNALSVFTSDVRPENVACIISVPKSKAQETRKAAAKAARREPA